jgi:hypothetical protein
MKDEDNAALVLAAWSLTMMRRAFRDLAIGFAAVDSDAADRTVMEIEKMVVVQLTALRDKPPKGIVVPPEAVVEIARNFREMSQGARQDIRQATKPH